MMKDFSHIDKNGKAAMVDVSEKNITERTAEAYAEVNVSEKVFSKIKLNEVAKGDVLTVAKIAGIQAAKKTSELIPLCHNIFISKIDLNFELNEESNTIEIYSFAKTNSVTGVEMEALTAVNIAAITIYDMCKSIDKSIKINNIHLLSKTGGKSGNYSA
ncbi:MAG: cyclic pyranopterin monophosphate synthase MoaC [Bacteroidetes bacterium]|nr:cyclic pyranopterin monophosphate synthase MoaC [Bacteroidota bacterium]